MISNRNTGNSFVGLRGLALAVVVLAFATSNAIAEDLFWSSFPLNGGATNSGINIDTTTVGDTGTLYLYYDATNLLGTQNISMDLTWVDQNVIAFQSAESFNYDVTTVFGNGGVQPRWDSFGAASSVSGNLVTILGASASSPVAATGINENFNGMGPFGEIDAGYDAGAGAFLVAAFDWERVAEGETTLAVISPSIDGGMPTVAPATFGFSAVPEPSTVSIFAIGLIGLVTRRRRK